MRAAMVGRFHAFVKERNRIFARRVEGKSPPWTDDPILRAYRFTNVNRENDRVTIWVRRNIREPFAQHANLWLMLALARQINWPDTLQELMDKGAWPVGDYDPRRLRNAMLARQRRGDKLYTGAYMINAQYGKETQLADDKAYFTAYLTILPLWKARNEVLAGAGDGTGRGGPLTDTLARAHACLTRFRGWGNFLAAQVVADLKHTRYLRDAPDWWDWAVLGPGSTRGLRRLQGKRIRKELKREFDPAEAIALLKELRKTDSALLVLCLQDLQNCLCEFDKYERVRLGQGRPRARFDGGAP